jgi:hypothetical protein
MLANTVATVSHRDSVTRKLNIILPNVWKKWPKISTPMLNLKAQNFQIKLLFKLLNKLWIETV